MNERCKTALRFPCARAQETTQERFWARMCVENRWLSTIVTVNK